MILSYNDYIKLLDAEIIEIDPKPEPSQLQPNSIEVRVGERIWESIKPNFTVSYIDSQILKKYFKPMEESDGFILEPGKTYIVESYEGIKLPWYLIGETETKSSVGRIGAIGYALGLRFGKLKPSAVSKKIYFLIENNAFSIKLIPTKTRTSQIILRRRGTTYLSAKEIKKVYTPVPEEILGSYEKEKELKKICLVREGEGLPFSLACRENGLQFTLSLNQVYVQKEGKDLEPIDLTKVEYYDPEQYFEVKSGEKGKFYMERGKLHLLGSRETVLQGDVYGKLERVEDESGIGMIHHLAGSFDLWFYGQCTFEAISYKDRILVEGQPMAKLILDLPQTGVEKDRRYGKPSLGSAYRGQSAPALPKFFKRKNI